MAIRIVVAGEIFIDQVLSGFTEWPRIGEEVRANSMIRELGGGAPNTTAGLSRLGWDVTLVGPIGKSDGGWVKERLGQLGLPSAGLQEYDDEPTGTTIAISFPENRTFFTYPGANRFLDAMLAELPEASHIHLACPCPAATLQSLCTKGATVSIDAGWNPDWLRCPPVLAALRHVSWFLPNESEAAYLTGETDPGLMLRRFRELHINTVIKMGSQGSVLMRHDQSLLSVPSIQVEAVDTTGAGDNFNAGFLHAWLLGKPPEEWLRTGNVCGALSTRVLGGMTGFLSTEELQVWDSR